MVEFYRTPEITEKIATVRSMPQETSGRDRVLSAEKREAAQELRMGIRLENAAFISEANKLVQRNPDIEAETLEKMLAATSTITHPENATKFVKQLIESRDTVQNIYEQLATKGDAVTIMLPGKKRAVAGQYVATGIEPLVSEIQTPFKGFRDKKYPFAVTVSASPELFKLLYGNDDEEKSVAGFYSASGYTLRDTEKEVIFPLLVVRQNYGANVDSHEQGHDLNAQFKKAMFRPYVAGNKTPTREDLVKSKAEHIATWGALRYISQKTYKELVAQVNPADEAAMEAKFRAMDWAVSYTCSCAKDELLADYVSSSREGEVPMKKHLQNLRENPIYDYFKKHLALDPESTLYASLKDKYLETLEYNVTPTMQVIERYQKCHWGCRVSAMRNVLMQIPLEKWKKTMETDLFDKESSLAEQCQEYQQLIEEYVGNMNFNFITMSGSEAPPQVVEHYQSKEDKERFGEIEDAFINMQLRFGKIKEQKNVTTPMVVPLEQLTAESEALFKKAQEVFESSDAYQYKVAFERLLKQFPEHNRENVKSWLTYDLAYSSKSFYGTLTVFQAKHKYQMESW